MSIMNKETVFAGAVGGLLVTGVASAGAFQSLTMTTYTTTGNGAPSNSITYRLFADLEAGASVTEVEGNVGDPILIGLTNGATFYQNANGGPLSTDINSNFFSFVPSMEWDSYVSIGALNQTDNTLATAGNFDFPTFEGGGDLASSGGSWSVADGAAQSMEQSGQVFLGQFTVLGGLGTVDDLIGQINLSGLDSLGNAWTETGATWNTGSGGSSGGTGGSSAVPGIGAIAPLCFVGLVRKRRRQG